MKPRQETLSLSQLLQQVKDEDIRTDADTQRYGYAWKSRDAKFALIRTVLSEGYIPDILLASVKSLNGQCFIVDGLQRITYLKDYRYSNNFSIPKKFPDSIVKYNANKKDEHGKLIRDKNGTLVKEEVYYDISGSSFEALPKELQKRFDTFQIHTALFYCEDMKEVAKLIEMYNNHTAMNAAQKSFSKVVDLAQYVRPIIESKFFAETIEEKKQHNGTANKIVIDSIILTNHRDNWKGKFDKQCEYFNNNSSKEEIEAFGEHLDRLYENVNVADERIKSLIASGKNTHIFLAVYERFLQLNKDDSEFEKFLIYFAEHLTDAWENLDADRHTRDTKIVVNKYLEVKEEMEKFFDLDPDEETDLDVNEFEESEAESERGNISDKKSVYEYVRENIDVDAALDDIDLYDEMVSDCVKIDSPLYVRCKDALIILMAYACKEEKDDLFESWAKKYDSENANFSKNQRMNYMCFKKSFDLYTNTRIAA